MIQIAHTPKRVVHSRVMATENDVDRYSKLAMLPGLEAARDRIDQQILEIRQSVWPEGRSKAKGISTGNPAGKKRGLTAAGRKRLSDLMKARWAQRRKSAKAKR